MLNDTFSRFRLISFIEGISYLILVFIAMPLKYILGYALAVKIVGMAHGVLFMLFVVALMMAENRYKWKFLSFQLFVYSLIPFGFILIEKIIMKNPPKKLKYMLFSKGFLGTSAPFYLDLATIYFAVLPFLLAFSIYLAVKKKYKQHFISQAMILITTLLIIVIFEIGIRISGGFLEYSKYSSISFEFMFIFLIIHILIAIIAVAGWLFLFISSYRAYKNNTFDTNKHKKIGKAIFMALTISSIMGICLYLFLFF